jgi:hypothetical protein
MRCTSVLFISAILLWFPGVARSQQENKPPVISPGGLPIPASSMGDCGEALESLHAARLRAFSDQSGPGPHRALIEAGGEGDAFAAAADSAEALKFLTEKQAEATRCILETYARDLAQDPPGACYGDLLLNFEMRHDGEPERDIPILRRPGNGAFFYESGMTIDADGAPNAYHPDNLGLDDLANAGSPGSWEGLAKDADGNPFIQVEGDPFPGYYVSATALSDHSKALNDPARYVDASKIPFLVLPGGMARQLGARVGDFAVVFNQRNGKFSYAIFGDVGPFDRIGEGSMALADNLGIRSDARNGGTRRGVLYLIFPGSGNGRPRTLEEINAEGAKLMNGWESSVLPAACVNAQSGQPPATTRIAD